MSKPREQLKHALKLVAGVPPAGLSDTELDLVIAEVSKKKEPTRQDWIEAVRRHVRGAGRYSYHSEDMSDLNMLLIQIINQAGGSGPTTVRK